MPGPAWPAPITIASNARGDVGGHNDHRARDGDFGTALARHCMLNAAIITPLRCSPPYRRTLSDVMPALG